MSLPQPEVPRFEGDPIHYNSFIMAFEPELPPAPITKPTDYITYSSMWAKKCKSSSPNACICQLLLDTRKLDNCFLVITETHVRCRQHIYLSSLHGRRYDRTIAMGSTVLLLPDQVARCHECDVRYDCPEPHKQYAGYCPEAAYICPEQMA